MRRIATALLVSCGMVSQAEAFSLAAHQQYLKRLNAQPHAFTIRVSKVVEGLPKGQPSGGCTVEGVVTAIEWSRSASPLKKGERVQVSFACVAGRSETRGCTFLAILGRDCAPEVFSKGMRANPFQAPIGNSPSWIEGHHGADLLSSHMDGGRCWSDDVRCEPRRRNCTASPA